MNSEAEKSSGVRGTPDDVYIIIAFGSDQAMNIDDKDKVAILLQVQKTATDQMGGIKADEMLWLKVFLLFYGAIIAWIVGRWFGPTTGSVAATSASSADCTLLTTALTFSFVGTVMFAFLFIHTRHSYYLVVDRLHRVQQCLKLYDPAEWGDLVFFASVHSPGKVLTFRQWCQRTKPWSSFLTRMVYMVGAECGIVYLIYLAYERIAKPKDGYFLAWWMGLNAALAVVVYAYDFYHFRTRDAT